MKNKIYQSPEIKLSLIAAEGVLSSSAEVGEILIDAQQIELF